MKPSAVVFAYHNIGVTGIECLLQAGVEIKLVVTHQDDPAENIWFGSVAELANRHHIPVITPENPNQADVIEHIAGLKPQWFFSFYYRHMLSPGLLTIPPRGAYNLHGSLLPKYRGRAPVNWAVLHGESTTGVSLHQMVEKPDAGSLIDQEAVAILPNDSAHDVFLKLTPAAKTLLDRCLPLLLDGKIEAKPLDLAQGSYFGGRKPEHGRIDWQQSAWTIHNLVRAVAPPYPGAFFDSNGKRIFLLGSHYTGEAAMNQGKVCIYWADGHFYADCMDNKRFRIEQLTCDGISLDQAAFKSLSNDDRLFPIVNN
ncbi:formyltransferase [Methylobacter sp.]|uniref:formyltransferase n=1 Tax=Methylobacter sp. TaxID=2051955 RepID=UPI002FDDBDAE